MKYELINQPNPNYSALEQVLVNRGIKYEEIPHYINTTDDDINSFLLLGRGELGVGFADILWAIYGNKKAGMIIDVDNDGYGAAAIFINFLHDVFPTWVENNLSWFHHKKKQHGLKDCIDFIIEQKYDLVICLDSGTNDREEHKKIAEYGGRVLAVDHHLLEGEKSEYAVIINNQIGDYPNKDFCGAAVTWQFCRFMNSLLEKDYQVDMDKYIDMVALCLISDMIDLKSIETKHLINKGFMPENIHNPFIYEMWQKNKFKLGDHITGWGAAFYIVPFVNAITRSGTQEEKELVFNSMLTFKAFEMIPSTKRGCKDQEERLVDQAIRTCTNVKNRQTKAQTAGMELLENMILEKNLDKNKVLLFLLQPGQIDTGIAGLIANKFMAKYQKPCCILTRIEDENGFSYQGSARGCDRVGITNFKQVCEDTECINWSVGHKSAFGLSIQESKVDEFIKITNEKFKNISDEPIYYVDYIYNGINVNPQNIIDIAGMNSYWGTGCEESLVAIKNLKITKDMITLMSPDKSPTLKIILPNKVSIIKFNSSQEEYEKFISEGYVEVDMVGKCNKNEWMGNVTPQILIEDIDIVGYSKYYF